MPNALRAQSSPAAVTNLKADVLWEEVKATDGVREGTSLPQKSAEMRKKNQKREAGEMREEAIVQQEPFDV